MLPPFHPRLSFLFINIHLVLICQSAYSSHVPYKSKTNKSYSEIPYHGAQRAQEKTLKTLILHGSFIVQYQRLPETSVPGQISSFNIADIYEFLHIKTSGTTRGAWSHEPIHISFYSATSLVFIASLIFCGSIEVELQIVFEFYIVA